MEIAKDVAKSGFMSILFDNPIIMLLIAIIGIVLTVVGLFVLSSAHLLTGIIIAIVLCVVIFAIVKTGVMPLNKYPLMGIMLGLIPLMGFLAGVAMDYNGMFVLTPLAYKASGLSAYYAGGTSQWIQTNPETIVVTILAVCMLAIIVVKGKHR